MDIDRRFATRVATALLAAATTMLFPAPARACSIASCGPLPIQDRDARERELQDALRRVQDLDGGTSLAVAEALDRLGQFYAETDESYDHAEPWFRRAAAISKTAAGPDSREYGMALHTLADYLEGREATVEAEFLLHHVLAIGMKDRDPETDELSWERITLARFHERHGDWRQAEGLWWETLLEFTSRGRTLAAAARAFARDSAEDEPSTEGEEPPEEEEVAAEEDSDAAIEDEDLVWAGWHLMMVQESLARVLEAQGRFREAMPLRRELFAFMQATDISTDAPRDARRALADVLARVPDRAEAEQLYRYALAEIEAAGGTETIEYAELTEALAGVTASKTSPEVVEEMQRSARALRRRLLSRVEAQIAVYEKEESCEIYGAYDAWIKNITELEGAASPSLVPVLERYAAFERRRGSIPEARRLEARAREIRQARSFTSMSGSPRLDPPGGAR